MRLGNSRLLTMGEAARLALRSPRCFANTVRDRVSGIGSLDFPRRIVLHLANRCDFACPMCSIGQARAERQKEFRGDVPFGVVEKIVREAAPHGCYVELLGGEPLLYQKLGDTIRLLSENHLLSYITTDGFKLKKKAADLVDAGLKVLMISLDGWDEESQYHRGLVRGSFNAIVDGVAEVRKLRRRRAFPIIRVTTVPTKANYHSLDKIAEAVYEMGVRRWVVSNYFFMTDAAMAAHQKFKLETGIGDQLMQHHIPGIDSYFNREEVAVLKQSLGRLREKLAGPLRDMRVDCDWNLDLDKYYSPRPPGPTSSCNLPFDRVDIHTDGRIAVCGDGHTIGNVNSGTITEAWSGEKYRRFRGVLNKHKIMPMCFRCCGIMGNLRFDDSVALKPELVNIAVTLRG